jgi:hypothetical protein
MFFSFSHNNNPLKFLDLWCVDVWASSKRCELFLLRGPDFHDQFSFALLSLFDIKLTSSETKMRMNFWLSTTSCSSVFMSFSDGDDHFLS